MEDQQEDQQEEEEYQSTKIGDTDLKLEEIHEWNPKTLVDYATVIVTARRRSGKSFLVKNVIALNKDRYDEIYIFSATIDKPLNAADYFFIPPQNRYTKLDEQKIQSILDKQNDILLYNEHRKKKDQIKSHICIILDDILTDTTFRKQNGVVSELFVQGRHSMITCFTIVQSFSGREGVHPTLRKNSDLIISFFQHNINDRKSMAEQFLSLIDTKVGMEYLRRITNEKHTACVIDVNNVSARRYNEYVYKYKAPDKKLPNFMIGQEEKRLREQKNTILISKQDNETGTPIKGGRKQSKLIKINTPKVNTSTIKTKEKRIGTVSVRLKSDINHTINGINLDPIYDI